MKLIIIRHGETEGNVRRILAGTRDKLTAKGINQAKKLALRLKDEKIDAIFSSPLIRAKETAQIIARGHPNAKFIVVDELREAELGSYLNKGFDEVDWDLIPKDVENRTNLYKRAKIIIEKVFKKYPKSTILFVAHNAINKAIIRVLRGWHPEEKRSIPQDNTAVSIFEISEKKKKEILFNCTKHLS